jgi:Ala-tRNA(Pro) deacylase
MTVATTVQEYLDKLGVSCGVVTHAPTMGSSGSAAASHLSGDRIAKGVLLKDEDGYLLAVLPASHRISLDELARLLGRPLALASEDEVGATFADCDLGAIPAVGAAYDLEVIVDEGLLAGTSDVYFEGGDHTTLVQVSDEGFKTLMADARSELFSEPA